MLKSLTLASVRIGKIHNYRTVAADSQPIVGHYAGKALTGDYPDKVNREGIAASSR